MVEAIAAGRVIGGRFRLVRRVGRGGFGEVWYAQHTATGQAVAVKLLLSGEDASHVSTERFLREAQTISMLKNPNTVRLYDSGKEADGQLYMVLEYIEGETLQERLGWLEARGFAATQADVGELAIQVLRSLDEAHAAGIVHRDIKPGNLMLQPVDSDSAMVRVVDFGVARTLASKLTGGGLAVGTPAYMSPEQCLGHAVDGRADLYGLGVVMFHCLAGVLPFEGKPYAVVLAHCSRPPPSLQTVARTPVTAGFVAVIERALAKDPGERFAGAQEMRRALEAVRAEAPVVPNAPSLLAPAQGAAHGAVALATLPSEVETAVTLAEELPLATTK